MVQGDGAAETIVAGIRLLNRVGVDVIIVGRGGGSIEDLWPFNEEIVARAIYESQAPVVSAVGHETDFTIADFVADVRAPTPTGAAAIILRDKSEIRSEIQSYRARSDRAVLSILDRMRRSFDVMDSKLGLSKAKEGLGMYRMNLDELSLRADHALAEKVRSMRSGFSVLDARLQPARALEDIGTLRSRADTYTDRVGAIAVRTLERGSDRLSAVSDDPERCIRTIIEARTRLLVSESKHLEGLNPLNVLTRGYSMIASEDGSVITSAERISVGDTVTIRFRDGSAKAGIKDKEMKI
jgi:exodeoxyribonuclease VII large subunit